ncbi:MAG: methionine biosynthesis protein MetW [Pseudomonadota bacterium]|jgi:methionine biosynthesis protein MetW
MTRDALRPDLMAIADLVPAGARVLDVGAGDGALMAYLERVKGCDARGIELSQDGVHACVASGLSVVQGDADTDLANYPTDGFDLAVLSQTLQATHQPRKVLEELLRIAPRAIVSIPNFAHWRVRISLLLKGRMPVTPSLPKAWYETPNIHLCTVRDFTALAATLDAAVEALICIDAAGRARPGAGRRLADINWRAEQAIFLLARR